MTTTPAGWYPDPYQGGMLRYWDGAAWTGYQYPAAQVPAQGHTPASSGYGAGAYQPGRSVSPPTDPSHALHYLVPVGRSGVSIAAPYVGLVALLLSAVPLVGLAVAAATIWIAVVALKKAKMGGHGTGRAIVALVFAGLAIMVNLTVLTVMLVQ